MTLALVAEPLPASQAVLELFEDYGRLVEHLGQDGRRVGYQLGVNRDAAAVLREHDRATGLLRSRVGADQDAPRDLHRFGCHVSGRHRSEIVALEIRVRATLRELHSDKCAEIDKVCGYFTAHQHRMKYDEYLAAGDPIGRKERKPERPDRIRNATAEFRNATRRWRPCR